MLRCQLLPAKAESLELRRQLMHEARIPTRYLSSNSGSLLCSLEPFRMLTSAWARLPVLGDYGCKDLIASLVPRLPHYCDIADSAKASCSIAQVRENKNTIKNFSQKRSGTSSPSSRMRSQCR